MKRRGISELVFYMELGRDHKASNKPILVIENRKTNFPQLSTWLTTAEFFLLLRSCQSSPLVAFSGFVNQVDKTGKINFPRLSTPPSPSLSSYGGSIARFRPEGVISKRKHVRKTVLVPLL